jgi:N-acetylmuramoyl-L-alanine amidase
MSRLSAAVAVLLTVLLAPAAATAQSGAVTLEASARRVVVGEPVTLSGAIAPPEGGETVQVLDGTDAVVGSAATSPDGTFSLTIEPAATATYRAVWGEAVSEPVTVEVRADPVTVAMTPARLFDRVTIRGTAPPGADVEVELRRAGRTVDSAHTTAGTAGRFALRLRIMEPGRYRARATAAADGQLPSSATSEARMTPLPTLLSGSRGVFVRLLERRLVELSYRLAGADDGVFDWRTADAVIAFHKVRRMARTTTVDPATWRALADPIVPRPRHDWKGFHFEVDQTRQVLLAVRGGEVTAILHVSSGKPSTPTRDGIFRVARKIAGYSPNRLYYPSYFDGNRALHGWTEVPTYPASHGCVRIPYWNALWVYGQADYGTRVAVYH